MGSGGRRPAMPTLEEESVELLGVPADWYRGPGCRHSQIIHRPGGRLSKLKRLLPPFERVGLFSSAHGSQRRFKCPGSFRHRCPPEAGGKRGATILKCLPGYESPASWYGSRPAVAPRVTVPGADLRRREADWDVQEREAMSIRHLERSPRQHPRLSSI